MNKTATRSHFPRSNFVWIISKLTFCRMQSFFPLVFFSLSISGAIVSVTQCFFFDLGVRISVYVIVNVCVCFTQKIKRRRGFCVCVCERERDGKSVCVQKGMKKKKREKGVQAPKNRVWDRKEEMQEGAHIHTHTRERPERHQNRNKAKIKVCHHKEWIICFFGANWRINV